MELGFRTRNTKTQWQRIENQGRREGIGKSKGVHCRQRRQPFLQAGEHLRALRFSIFQPLQVRGTRDARFLKVLPVDHAPVEEVAAEHEAAQQRVQGVAVQPLRRHLVEPGAGRLQVAQHPLDGRQDFTRGRRRLKRARRAVEQAQTERLFHLPDQYADRGLGDEQLVGRAGQDAEPAHLGESAQLLDGGIHEEEGTAKGEFKL